MGLEEESKQQQQQQQQQEAVDVFDLLPDALILEIFNRVQDARSLSACTTLCKRFEHLVTQTDIVSLQIIRRNKPRELTNVDSVNSKPKAFFGRFILSPIQSVLHRMFSRKPKACAHCSDEDEDEDEAATFKLPNDLLKNFKEIKSLSVKLPGHDGDISSENGSGALLKWKAEFGKELESCVILGATGFREKEMKPVVAGKSGESLPGEPVTRNLTNKQLKKRVVWTISCLIASSARHHMLKRIVSMNPMIKDVTISDGSKQGTIRMNERQVVELREEMEAVDEVAEEERTKVPAVVIKMWYLPVLELPESGCVMKGATLAVIRPAGATAEEKEDDVSLAMGAFEEKCMGEAVRKLVERKKSYTLEMNSF